MAKAFFWLILFFLAGLLWLTAFKYGHEYRIALATAIVATATLFVTLFTSVYTRVSRDLTKQTLDPIQQEIRLRIRPFVSIVDIAANPGPWNGFSLPLQNTGLLPADELNILVSFIDSKTGKTEHVYSQKPLTLLAPSSRQTINVYDLPQHLEEITRAGNMQVQLLVKYRCFGTDYETQQTYTIEKATRVATASIDVSEFVFRPTAPAHWT